MYLAKHIREEYSILECDAMLAGRNISVFRRNFLPPSLQHIVNVMDKTNISWTLNK
jgi:hypothetical protein